jgi:orotidine-5'-phosphate decarboxylase
MKTNYYNRLEVICQNKKSHLCIGLDFDLDKMINKTINDLSSLESFIRDIIDCTHDICAVYKPNFAFYEKYGPSGMRLLENIVSHINKRSLVIADAKRGDIGNTSASYAQAIFDYYDFDAITIAPYMGTDSIEPFISDPEKGVYILCLTSNQSASDFQYKLSNNRHLYEDVAKLALSLNKYNNLGLVVGATKKDEMNNIRKIAPSLNWLVPGIGAQGGNLKESVCISNKDNASSVINVSRSIIYSKNQTLDDIRSAAVNYNKSINKYLTY